MVAKAVHCYNLCATIDIKFKSLWRASQNIKGSFVGGNLTKTMTWVVNIDRGIRRNSLTTRKLRKKACKIRTEPCNVRDWFRTK